MRAGVVWANTFNRFDPSSPFGGYKESGYGREGGRHGLAAYLKPASSVARGSAQRRLGTGAVAASADSETVAARPARSTKRAKKGIAK